MSLEATCEGKLASVLFSSFKEAISTSQRYELVPDLSDHGKMDAVLIIQMACGEHNNFVSVGSVYGMAKCFGPKNCHLSLDGRTLNVLMCDPNGEAICGKELFKEFEYVLATTGMRGCEIGVMNEAQSGAGRLAALHIVPFRTVTVAKMMSALFSHAVRWEFCGHNPISSGIPVGSGDKRGPSTGVRISAKRQRSPLVLSPEQVKLGLAELEFRDQLLVFLEGALGIRQGELGALRWLECDFENMSFSVQHSYYWRRGGNLKSTKTEASAKLLPMHPSLKIPCRSGGRKASTTSRKISYSLPKDCKAASR